jgi:PAS domain S-box-containing protein
LITHLATPLYDENNELVGCLVVFQDRLPLVDLINRVNYEEKSLKTILDRLDLPIFLVNRGGYLTFFNDAAESITGYDRRQVLGKSSSFILGPENEKAGQNLKSTLTDGRPHSIGSTPITTQKGELVDVKAELVPLRNNQNQIVGGLVTLQDLTLARRLDEVITEQYSFHNMVGKDPAMKKLYAKAVRTGPSRGGQRCYGFGRRSHGHGQGHAGPGHSFGQPSQQPAPGEGQLRGPAGQPAGIGNVRVRQRSFYRRGS